MRKRKKIAGHNGRRKPTGYALVAILTVSLFATMLLLTLAGLTVSLTRSESFYKQRELALVGADVGLDYVRKSLNNALMTGTPSILEPANGETERISELPASLVPQGDVNSKVLMRVRRLTPAELSAAAGKQSPAVMRQWNPNNYKKLEDWKYGDDWRYFSAPQLSYFWMVEVTSYRGMFATSTRSMLAPELAAPTLGPSASPPSKNSMFVQGIVADQDVNLAPSDGYLDVLSPGEGFSNAQTTGVAPNSSFKAVVQSNTSATASSNTNVYGDLRVTNPIGATNPVLAATDTGGQASNAMVWGRAQTNSVLNSEGGEVSINGLQGTPGDLPTGTDNVFAFSDYFSSLPDSDAFWSNGMREGLNETSPVSVLPEGTTNQVSPNPVPTGPQGSPLPDFPMPPPVDSGAPMPGDISVSPGVYRTPAIDSTGAVAKLVFNESGGSTAIYIDADGTAPNAIKLNSQFLQNLGDAKDLQIYYAGDKDLRLTLDGDLAGALEMKAFIYAPNAKVTTSGFGEFQGAILSKSLQVNHVGDFRIDPDASRLMIDRSGQSGGGGSAIVGQTLPTHYRVASWQQVSGSLVQAP